MLKLFQGDVKWLKFSQIYRKNDTFFSTIKNENTIGIVLSGLLQIVKIDYEGNKTLIEELEDGDIFGSTISSIQNAEHNIVIKEDSTIILIDYSQIINC